MENCEEEEEEEEEAGVDEAWVVVAAVVVMGDAWARATENCLAFFNKKSR
jgi:hypothetical protein